MIQFKVRSEYAFCLLRVNLEIYHTVDQVVCIVSISSTHCNYSEWYCVRLLIDAGEPHTFDDDLYFCCN
jgi:hypothetical protein